MPTATDTQVEMQIDAVYDGSTTTSSTSYDDNNQMDYEIIEINKVRAVTTGIGASAGAGASAAAVVDLEDMDVEMMNQIDIDTNELRLIAVLDTNIFVSNLGELEHVAAVSSPSSRMLFMVPWVVLQELDGLKTRSVIVGVKAKQAIHFIHSVLSSRAHHSNFAFENPIQSQEASTFMKCEKNDDKILRCALKMSLDCPGYHVIIISNDINLINKSIISNMKAITFNQFKHNLDQLIGTTPPTTVNNNPTSETQTQSVESKYLDEPIVKEFFKDLSDTYEKQLNELIVGCLSIFFEFEMKQMYQDLWLDLLLHKPPWSLATLMPSFNKSFSALFGFTGSKNSMKQKNSFDSLKEKTQIYLNSITKPHHNKRENLVERFRQIVKISIETLSFLENFDKNKYGSKFNEYLAKLEYFKSNGVKICNVFNLIGKFLESKDSDVESNHSGVELLEKIWHKYQFMSGLTLDSIRKHLDSNSHSSKSFRSDESRFLLEILICASTIKSFRRFYEKCLDNQTNFANLSRATYALLKLFNFENEPSQVYLLNLNSELRKYLLIERSLKDCFADANNRQSIRNVFDQLKEFEGNLKSMNFDEIFSFVLNK